MATPGWLADVVSGDLISDGRVVHGWLGITGETVPISPTETAVKVVSVDPGGAAAKAGVKPGDIIEAVNGERRSRCRTWWRALYSLPPNRSVKLDLDRAGHCGTRKLVSRQRPEPGPCPSRARPSIGLVSDPLASGGGDFLRNMLGDLLRLIRTEGPLQWELAFQLATSVAAGDEPDPNPDPIARIRLEELSAIAELHVADVTGMVLGSGVSGLRLVPTTRVEWARRSLEAWRPLLDRLAAALTSTPEGPGRSSPTMPGRPDRPVRRCRGRSASGRPRGPALMRRRARAWRAATMRRSCRSTRSSESRISCSAHEPVGDDDPEDMDLAEMIGRWTSAMAPAMAAMQVGSVVGHLARRSLGPVRPAVAPYAFERDPRRRWQPGPLRRGVEPSDRRSPALALRARDGLSRRSGPPARGERLEELVVAHSSSSAPTPATSRDCCRGSTRGASQGCRRSSGDPSLLGEAGSRALHRSSRGSAPSSPR